MLRTCSINVRTGSNDIGEAIEMKTQQAKLDQLIDEVDGALIERLAERQERKEHADRKPLIGEDKAGTQINDNHVDQSREQRLDEAESNLVLSYGNSGIGDFSI